MKIQVRTAHELEELSQVVELEKRVFGFSERELVPVHLLRSIIRCGGVVHIASVDDLPVGFGLALAAFDEEKEFFLFSEIVGVVADQRRKNVGFTLKSAQRTFALERGAKRIKWTSNPLLFTNAHFNLMKLGARVERFVPNAYGTLESSYYGPEPSDRFLYCWNLEDRMSIDEKLWQAPDVIAHRNDTVVYDPQQSAHQPPALRLSFPRDARLLRETFPERRALWQTALRTASTDLLNGCYSVVSVRAAADPSLAEYLLLRNES